MPRLGNLRHVRRPIIVRVAARPPSAETRPRPRRPQHLRNILSEYVAYYNRSRCHRSLEGNAPEPRLVEDGDGSVYAIPHMGGLHHEYRRAG